MDQYQYWINTICFRYKLIAIIFSAIYAFLDSDRNYLADVMAADDLAVQEIKVSAAMT